MGLFKKRAADKAEMERLRAEIESMSARLDAADAAKEELGQQVRGIEHRLDTPPAPDEPPPPPPPTIDPGELVVMRARLRQLAERLEASDAAKAELGEQVRGIVTRLETPLPTPQPPAAPAPTATAVDAAELAELRTQVQHLADRIVEVDVRVTAISTELANQIDELGTELVTLAERPEGAPVADELVDELRDAQTRLANEQARYQIAFRQDLADLADRLRRA